MKKILQLLKKCIWIPMRFVLPIMLLLPFYAAAQNSQQINSELEKIIKYSGASGWFEFKEDVRINPISIFVDYKTAFNLGIYDEMRLMSQKPDKLGYTHYKYQQYYKGIRVSGAEFIVHQNNSGRVYSANGKIVSGINTDISNPALEPNALAEALKYVKSDAYYWKNEERELEIRQKNNDPSASWFPKGELVFARKQGSKSFEASQFYFCYKFDIHVENLSESKTLFIEAHNGELINSIRLNHECSAGTGTTNYNGSVSLNTQLNASNYRLWNDCQTADIVIRNRNASTNNSGWTEYLDANNAWTDVGDRSGVQAMYTMNQTRLYYSGVHSRNSFDNAGGDIVVYNNAGFFDANNNVYGTNAFASNDGNFYFGYGSSAASTADDWNGVDVAGHEFTHFVTGNEAGLVYQDESGALNESFSDIFGEMVESYTLGINDYLIGTDIGAIRDMSNPNFFNDPDTYLGTNWCDYTNPGLNCTMNDFGGVHTNSGVQNFFFFLLSEGGNGTNDNGEAFNVSGISRFTARDIGYRALTVYLTANDEYIDSREAWLRAAFDLYGNCSNEIVQVGNAWRAVGVGSQAANYVNNVCGTYPALGTYAQAISYLQVSNGGCLTTITPSATTVYFHATDRVRMFPGFTAQAGSKFYAYIQPCDISIWRTTDNRSDAESGLIPDKSVKVSEATHVSSIEIVPNPFSSSVKIGIQLYDEQVITVTLYDALGRKVYTVADKTTRQAGKHYFEFDGRNLTQGVYMCVVKTGTDEYRQQLVKTD